MQHRVRSTAPCHARVHFHTARWLGAARGRAAQRAAAPHRTAPHRTARRGMARAAPDWLSALLLPAVVGRVLRALCPEDLLALAACGPAARAAVRGGMAGALRARALAFLARVDPALRAHALRCAGAGAGAGAAAAAATARCVDAALRELRRAPALSLLHLHMAPTWHQRRGVGFGEEAFCRAFDLLRVTGLGPVQRGVGRCHRYAVRFTGLGTWAADDVRPSAVGACGLRAVGPWLRVCANREWLHGVSRAASTHVVALGPCGETASVSMDAAPAGRGWPALLSDWPTEGERGQTAAVEGAEPLTAAGRALCLFAAGASGDPTLCDFVADAAAADLPDEALRARQYVACGLARHRSLRFARAGAAADLATVREVARAQPRAYLWWAAFRGAGAGAGARLACGPADLALALAADPRAVLADGAKLGARLGLGLLSPEAALAAVRRAVALEGAGAGGGPEGLRSHVLQLLRLTDSAALLDGARCAAFASVLSAHGGVLPWLALGDGWMLATCVRALLGAGGALGGAGALPEAERRAARAAARAAGGGAARPDGPAADAPGSLLRAHAAACATRAAEAGRADGRGLRVDALPDAVVAYCCGGGRGLRGVARYLSDAQRSGALFGALLRAEPRLLESASRDFALDEAAAVRCVSSEGALLRYARGLRDCPAVCAAAVRRDPHALQWAFPSYCMRGAAVAWCATEAVVRAAVEADSAAFRHADVRFRGASRFTAGALVRAGGGGRAVWAHVVAPREALVWLALEVVRQAPQCFRAMPVAVTCELAVSAAAAGRDPALAVHCPPCATSRPAEWCALYGAAVRARPELRAALAGHAVVVGGRRLPWEHAWQLGGARAAR
jgi:hypothetical protein